MHYPIRFSIPILVLCVTFAIAAVSSARAATLEAGIAVTNITPDVKKHPTPLGGYGERQNAPAVGIHDYTLAKALILKQGDSKFALVTLDLLGVPRSSIRKHPLYI